MEYNESETLRDDLSEEDLQKAKDEVTRLSEEKKNLERTIANAKGDLARATEDMKAADAVRTELATLRTLQEAYDKARTKIADQIKTLEELDFRQQQLEENGDPSDPEFENQMGEINQLREAVGSDDPEKW